MSDIMNYDRSFLGPWKAPASIGKHPFVVLRHAQTDFNTTSKTQTDPATGKTVTLYPVQGRGTETSINALGELQAMAAGRVLSQLNVRMVICSPNRRCVQTARAAGLVKNTVAFHLDENAFEADFGVHEGGYLEAAAFQSDWESTEKKENVSRRAHELLKHTRNPGAVIVTSGNMLTTICTMLDVSLTRDNRSNGAVLRFAMIKDRWTLERLKPTIYLIPRMDFETPAIDEITKGPVSDEASKASFLGYKALLGKLDPPLPLTANLSMQQANALKDILNNGPHDATLCLGGHPHPDRDLQHGWKGKASGNNVADLSDEEWAEYIRAYNETFDKALRVPMSGMATGEMSLSTNGFKVLAENGVEWTANSDPGREHKEFGVNWINAQRGVYYTDASAVANGKPSCVEVSMTSDLTRPVTLRDKNGLPGITLCASLCPERRWPSRHGFTYQSIVENTLHQLMSQNPLLPKLYLKSLTHNWSDYCTTDTEDYREAQAMWISCIDTCTRIGFEVKGVTAGELAALYRELMPSSCVLADLGRVVLVSGANRGIGKVIAELLIENGYRVSLGARNIDALHEIFGPEDDRRHYARFEATDVQTMTEWVASAVAKFGRIDALVNNAGWGKHVTLMEGSSVDLEHQMQVNFHAPVAMMRLCMPYLEETGQGRIVTICSMSGVRVPNEFLGYNASKAALIAANQVAGKGSWDKGVRTSIVCPGFVGTEMSAWAKHKMSPQDMISSEEVAEAVLFLLTRTNRTHVPELQMRNKWEPRY